jgi:hypothetical protein
LLCKLDCPFVSDDDRFLDDDRLRHDDPWLGGRWNRDTASDSDRQRIQPVPGE